ncbi:MAG: hypothetical protein JWL87_589 [Candidatus Adlerbacteria bacterium]|nr:hypothetical protein [Candidatus Adlerbacteria bacterium]
MKKVLHVASKVVFSLILILPVLGTTGIFGEATRDLYNTDLAFAFIQMLTSVMYINWIMAVVNVVALIALWTKREALAALLIAPITVNVVAFHFFIDGGLLTAGAGLADIMLLLNAYFLWKNRTSYTGLLKGVGR